MIYPTLRRGRIAPTLWDDLFSARREVEQAFDRFFVQPNSQAAGVWAPVVDVRETGEGIQVSAELPGMEPGDVSVTVENGILTISGEKRQEIEEGKEDAGYHIFERRYGRFERSFTLPGSVAADQVKARFQNGLLTVTLPKNEAAKPRRVQVEVGAGSGKAQLSRGKS